MIAVDLVILLFLKIVINLFFKKRTLLNILLYLITFMIDEPLKMEKHIIIFLSDIILLEEKQQCNENLIMMVY